jgi:hypothetical protein
MDLEKKLEQRRSFLRRLYQATDGHRFTFRDASDIGTSLGLTPAEIENVTDYLTGQGLVKRQTLGGVINITPEGVQEVERAMAEEKQAPLAPRIPAPVIAEVAQAFDTEYTHTQIDNLFMRADAPGDPPGGSKLRKVGDWLRLIDADPEADALGILGRLLEEFMDRQPPSQGWGMSEDHVKRWHDRRSRVKDALAARGLSYQIGGKIIGGTGLLAPSRSLADLIRKRDLPAISTEFDRAYAKVLTDPAGAVTAACAILEATCHTYIADEGLTPPTDKSLHLLWKVVQGHLGLAPTAQLEDDLKKMVGGLASIVDGIGAFRTHAGDAHGRGPDAKPIEPRHARLAVHSAHTVVTFVLETWAARPK